MKSSILTAIGWLCAAFIYVGCDTQNFLVQFEGTYRGFLKETGQAGNKSFPVFVNIQASGKDSLLIFINSTQPLRNERLLAKVVGAKSVSISSSSNRLLAAGTVLKQDSENCFSGDSKDTGNVFHAELCLKENEFSLDLVQNISGQTDHEYRILVQKTDAAGSMEQPREYKIAELFQMSLSKNFDSRIQFETYKGAVAQAKNAYGNLLPHLTGNTIVGLATFSGIAGAYGMIGDLAPFLLPNRWFQAKETSRVRDAQKMAVSVMRANSGNIIEGLALSVMRDEAICTTLQRNLKEVTLVRDEVAFREKYGTMPIGSGDILTTAVNNIEQTLVALETGIEEEYLGISNAVGFLNPKAVLKLTNDNQDSVLTPVTLDVEELNRKTLEQSEKGLELAQLQKLREAAQMDTKGRYFNWMDPSGDPAAGLGFGFAGYIEVAKSNERLIRLQIEKMQAALLQKVGSAVAEYKGELNGYKKAKEGYNNQKRIVDLYLNNIKYGIAFNLPDLATALQAKAGAEVLTVTLDYSYRINLDRIRRLTLSENYGSLPAP